MGEDDKLEMRNSNFETNLKFEAQNAPWISDFEFETCFEFSISIFEFFQVLSTLSFTE
jgi:hypothetical protein